MMMLELDYMSSFNDPYFDDNSSTLPYSTLTILFLLVFVLLMPILLVNLLVCVLSCHHVTRLNPGNDYFLVRQHFGRINLHSFYLSHG